MSLPTGAAGSTATPPPVSKPWARPRPASATTSSKPATPPPPARTWSEPPSARPPSAPTATRSSSIERVQAHVEGPLRARALALRADLLFALGDPSALIAYRHAIELADGDGRRLLRARLARAAVFAGDMDTAVAALEDVELERRRGRRGHPAGPQPGRLSSPATWTPPGP